MLIAEESAADIPTKFRVALRVAPNDIFLGKTIKRSSK